MRPQRRRAGGRHTPEKLGGRDIIEKSEALPLIRNGLTAAGLLSSGDAHEAWHMKNEGSKEAGVLLDVWSRRPRCPAAARRAYLPARGVSRII